MRRRDFSGRFTAVLTALGLAGCVSSDTRAGSSVDYDFDDVLQKFEDLLWQAVELGVSDVSASIGFGTDANKQACKDAYKAMRGRTNVLWYDVMKLNLREALAMAKDPTDANHDDFLFFYDGFYSCCRTAGVKAANLASKPTNSGVQVVIEVQHFKHAMIAVSAIMSRLRQQSHSKGRSPAESLALMCG